MRTACGLSRFVCDKHCGCARREEYAKLNERAKLIAAPFKQIMDIFDNAGRK